MKKSERSTAPRRGIGTIRLFQKKHPRLTKTLFLLSPFLIYLCISLLFFGRSAVLHMNQELFSAGNTTGTGDPSSFVWFLNWLPFSIGHGLNPFYSGYVWSPMGFNLTWSTSVPSLAILFAPITLIFNAFVTFNILAMLALPLAALSFFLLVYYLTKKYVPSLISGYIFGFSTYEIGQLLGHTNLYFTFAIPLVILLFMMRLRKRISRWQFIAAAGVLLAIQFGISSEVVVTFLFFGAISILCFLAVLNKKERVEIFDTVRESIGAGVVALIILSPYIYYLLKGLNVAVHSLPANMASFYSGDLLNFAIPTYTTLFGHTLFTKTTSNFVGNTSEEGLYLGVPFIALFIYVAVRYWHKAYVKALSVIMVILVICTMGVELRIGGTPEGLPLPWRVMTHIPMLRSALPDRFSMYLFVVLALLVGLWLANQEKSRKATYIKYGVTLIALAFLLPNFSYYSWYKISVPKLFQKNVVSSYIKPGSNVMILPYSYLGSSMYYQYLDGMSYKQVGGYLGYVPYTFGGNPLVVSLLKSSSDSTFSTDIVSFCKTNGISKIIYGPGTGNLNIDQLKSLHWPTETVGSETIITVPQTVRR